VVRPVKLLQPSFGGGEYAPALRGRADLARFGISGKQFRNFIVRPTGGFESRPGTQYVTACKYADKDVRLLPFQVSETLGYIVELGDQYARFHYRGAPVVDGSDVPVGIVTPWTEAELRDVAFTQSADVMFLTHGNHPPQLLRRVSATEFTLTEFVPRQGPFKPINGNEALLLACSARTGTITVTSNFDLFTADMVGGLIYFEPQKFGNVKPWAQGERTSAGGELAVGAIRSSDGKYYQAVTVAAATPPNYTETGNVRPTHETGRAWDGPGDSRMFDTITYTTGVEWEYLHSGYGIVKITGFTDAKHVVAEVVNVLPQEVVGGLGTPVNTWTLAGDGTTLAFSVAGATSPSMSSYTVTVDGVPL
jgi:hypothetical protein